MVRVLKSPSGRVSHETGLKLDRFFAGFGLADDRARRALVRRFGQGGSADRALAQAEAATAQWFAGILDQAGMPAPLALAIGRVAWLTAGEPRGDLFLAEAVSPGLAARLRAAAMVLPPTGRPAAMPASSLRRPTGLPQAAAIRAA
jgi:hypothetical protein